MWLLRYIHPSWQIVALLCGVIAGAILLAIFRCAWFVAAFWWVVAGIMTLFSIILSRTFCLFLAFLAGILLILTRAGPELLAQKQLGDYFGQPVTVSGVILSATKSDAAKTNLSLGEFAICENKTAENCRTFPGLTVFSQISTTNNLAPTRNSRVILTGSLLAGFGNFDASLSAAKIIQFTDGGDIFLRFRDWFSGIVRRFMPEPEVGLGLGYLLGDKSGVGDELQETLRAVGLTHIVVASGAHLSVIVNIAKRLFGKISRFASLLFALVFMLIFISITGLSASMLRAGIVSGLSLIFWYFGRKSAAWRVLLIAAGATLLYNPDYITELGWLLSFSSFTGILLVSPFLTSLFYSQRKKPGLVASTIIASLSANILCAPITLYFFGAISAISLLANVLILPTISIVMGLVFLTGATGIIFTPLATFFGMLAILVLRYQIFVINLCGEQTQFLIEISPYNPLVFLWYIIVLMFFIVIIWRKNHKKCYN